MEYTIREASKEDIVTLIDLCEEHAAFEGCSYERHGNAEKLAEHLFKENPSVKCFVVEAASGLQGYTTFIREFSTWDAGYYLHMDCLYLRPEFRGMGIGQKIMEQLKDEARLHQCINMQWHTPENNEDAIRFYQKMEAAPKKKVRFYLSV